VSWSAGPRARFVGDAYNEAYFGVNAAQAAASGLPVYDVSGGLYSYGAGASVIAPLSSDRSWALVFVAGYDRLTGDAGDSPLVQQRGDDDQASIGLFIARRLP
jgi:outer membrane protein